MLFYVPERNWVVTNCDDGSVRFLDAGNRQIQMSLVAYTNGRAELSRRGNRVRKILLD